MRNEIDDFEIGGCWLECVRVLNKIVMCVCCIRTGNHKNKAMCVWYDGRQMMHLNQIELVFAVVSYLF